MAKNKYHLKQCVLALLSLVAVAGLGKVAAATPVQSVVQSYNASPGLQKGMIVRLTGKNNAQVAPATLSEAEKMAGVVVSPADAAITLSSPSGTNQQVFVATSGRYDVLVSNQNGVINAGDYIAVSSIDGVGMKAGSHDLQVLGKAAGNFDGVHDALSTASVKNQAGKTVTVALGLIPADIDVGNNPGAVNTVGVPGFLQHATSLVTTKQVNSWRIYTGLVVIVATTIVAGSILYSGVRNGMVSIGRNPLAKSSIMRNLMQVVLTSVIIFIIGLFTVYLLLKL